MNLPESVHERAANQPEKIAYHFLNESVSYQQFDRSVAKFAGALKEIGIQKGDHIALLVGNTPHFLIALYASWRLGAVVVPINPTYTPNELSYIVQNSDAKLMIALDKLAPLIAQKDKLFPKIENVIVCETDEEASKQANELAEKPLFFKPLLQHAAPVNEIEALKKDDAIILYTSGTTGRPKGAMLTHENVYSNARDVGTYLKMTSEDKVIATLPVFHVFALTVVVNAPLYRGAEVILMPHFSPKKCLKRSGNIKRRFLRAFQRCTIIFTNMKALTLKITLRSVYRSPEVRLCRYPCLKTSRKNSIRAFPKATVCPKRHRSLVSTRWTTNEFRAPSELPS